MTFALQPYADIVDDLLTALTGGVVREEYIFSSGEMKYRLRNQPAKPASVKVYGTVSDKFYTFVREQDYDAYSDRIEWREVEGVVLPADGDRFYVNYYREGVEAPVTDRNVGSVTRLLAEAFASEFAILYRELLSVYNSGFVNTATGVSLDQVTSILGNAYKRKTGDYAVGEVTFFRNTPATGDIYIKDGISLSTETASGENPKVYITTAGRWIRKGQLSVSVPIVASKKGDEGIVGPQTIKIIHQPVLGIDGVTNYKAVIPQGIDEGDEALRERAKHALEGAGKTTVTAIKSALLGIPAIRDAKVEEDFSQGPGLVRVLVDADAITDELRNKIDEAIFETKAAGIKVVHNLGPPAGGEGETERPHPSLKKVNLDVEFLVSLSDPNITEQDREGIRKDIKDAVTAYLKSLKIGDSVSKSRLIAAVMGVEGIGDVIRIKSTAQVVSPPGTPVVGEGDVTLNSNERGESGKITVDFSNTPVWIDIKVDVNVLTAGIQPLWDIRTKLGEYLTETSGQVTTETLKDLFSGISEYEITGLILDAEYAKSGLILSRVDAITIASDETAVLRKLEANITGSSSGA
jgi:uncharacterized phage protein gp47/JayE